MERLIAAGVLVTTLLIGAAHPAAAGPECQTDRAAFEVLVRLRMLNYASTGDTWSPRARKWAEEIAANRNQGKSTPALDSAYVRFRRYCDEDDDFMAGLTLGEWIGIGLRAK